MSAADGSNKGKHGLAIGLYCALFVLLLFTVGVFERWELKLFDARVQRISPVVSSGASEDIVIVALDQSSLETCLKRTGHRWPWPREFYGKIVNFLTAAGAKAIVFDMYFTEPDRERPELPSELSDRAFSSAILKSGRVMHGYVLRTDALPLDEDKEASLIKRLDKYKGDIGKPCILPGYSTAEFPLIELEDGARALGFLNTDPDQDSIIRRSMLLAAYRGIPAVSMALTVAWDLKMRPDINVSKGLLEMADIKVPIDRYLSTWIWWYRPREGMDSPFRYYPAYSVLTSAVQMEGGVEPELDPSAFKDKMVFIGSTAMGLYDIKATPLSNNVPGVEVQATILSNILNGDCIGRAKPVRLTFLLVIACVVTAVSTKMFRNALGGVLVTSLVLFMVWMDGYWSLVQNHVFVDIIPVMLGALLSFVSAMVANYLSEQKHSKMVRGIFEHYLDRSVVKSLIADPEKVCLGGEVRVCTVIFSDVANFTSTSEMMDASQVVEFMNIYLNAMTEIIIEEGGFVDKYVGDEIVAIFGAPNFMPDHALRACRALVKMQKKIQELQPLFIKIGCEHEVFARSGANTGQMVVGNMGSEKRMNYTAMGDAMNLGARLEGTNKIYGTRNVVSEETMKAAKSEIVFRELDTVRVKGKATGIKIYELVCASGDVTDGQQEVLEKFERALALYRSAKWSEARKIFEENSQKGDGPSAVFVRRCDGYLLKPPEQGWDGVYVMEVK